MNASWVASSWAIAITASLMVGCSPEEFEQKQTQDPVQLSSSEQEIGSTEVLLPPALTTGASPGMMTLNNETYVFYRGVGPDCSIYMLRASGPLENQQWDGLSRLPGFINTSGGPSAVALGNTIYVVYKGAWDDTHIYAARSTDRGVHWDMAMFDDGAKTIDDPTAFVSGTSLYVLYRGTINGSHYPEIEPMYMARLPDQWTGDGTPTSPGIQLINVHSALSNTGPAMASLGSETYVVYAGVSTILGVADTSLYMLRGSGPIENRQWREPRRLPGAVNTETAPSVVTLDGTIYVVYRGLYDDTRIYVTRSTDEGEHWEWTPGPMTVNTTNRPTAFVSGTSLYVLYRGAYTDSRMFMARLSNAYTAWLPID